jgi:hypothetical protein
VRANWLYRLHVNPETHECAPLARKVILTFVVPWLILICLPAYSYFWGCQIGAIHTAVVAASCVLLVEGVLVRFRKIAFTCPVPVFKRHALVGIVLCIAGLFAFADATASIERSAIEDHFFFALFIAIPAAIWLALRYWRNNMLEMDRRLIFEEKPPAVVEALDLR